MAKRRGGRDRPTARRTPAASGASAGPAGRSPAAVDVGAIVAGVRDDEQQLRDLADDLVRAREALDQAAVEARAGGMSWHRIGLAVRLTAEGARRRWGGAR